MSQAGTDGAGRTATVVHSLIAAGLLLLFFSALGYDFLPQWAPAMLRTVQSARTLRATPVADGPLAVRNSSQASDAQVAGVARTLAADYAAITAFTGQTSPAKVPVLITDGAGPALADGQVLNVFYDNGLLNLDTAPFFLVLLADGKGIDFGSNLPLQAGFAIYVAEEIGRAQPLTGQPVDAWVKLLQQQGKLVALDKLQAVGIPRTEDDLYTFLTAMLEGGSFVRWVAKTQGMAAAQRLRQGEPPSAVLGMSLQAAETEWLAAVAALDVEPRPCALALPPIFPATLCQRLDS